MAYRKNRGRIESLGMRLAYLREMENLTQIELALKIGYSESMIRKWEKDEHCPRADVICEYSDLFNVSADWILFGND
jgi:transcriptional regulator with XRE-family HTH domain